MSKHRDELWNRLSDLLMKHGPYYEQMDDDDAEDLINGFIDGLEQDVFPLIFATASDVSEAQSIKSITWREVKQRAARNGDINGN